MAVLECVNLNFGENGKSMKKRRVDVIANALGKTGEIYAVNGD